MQRRLPLVVGSVDLCAPVQELRHDLGLPGRGGDDDRRPSKGVTRLNIGVVGEQKLQHVKVTARCGPMQCGAAVLRE